MFHTIEELLDTEDKLNEDIINVDGGEKENTMESSIKELDENINAKFNVNSIINKAISDIKLSDADKNSGILDSYIYRNEKNIPIYRVVRKNCGHPFSVQRFENGKFLYGINGIDRIPDHIPKLLHNKERISFIVNGENKADLLESLGFIATTAPFHYYNKWRKEYNSFLNNNGVVILQDDKKGNTTIFLITAKTVKEDIKNVGLVKVSDISTLLNLHLKEEATIIDLKNELHNDEKLKEIFSEIEESILNSTS